MPTCISRCVVLYYSRALSAPNEANGVDMFYRRLDPTNTTCCGMCTQVGDLWLCFCAFYTMQLDPLPPWATCITSVQRSEKVLCYCTVTRNACSDGGGSTFLARNKTLTDGASKPNGVGTPSVFSYYCFIVEIIPATEVDRRFIPFHSSP